MRTYLLTLLSIIWVMAAVPVGAQSCDLFFPQKEGATVTFGSYDEKDKKLGTISYTILSSTGNIKKVKSVFTDKKGNEGMENTFEVDCRDGSLFIDMRNFMPASSQSEGYSFEGEVHYLTIPIELYEGQQLPNGEMHITVNRNGDKFNETDLYITERTVLGRQAVTTPTGTYDCWVIASDVEIKTRVIGLVTPVIPIRFHTKEFYAAGVGLVRSESYNKKEKPLGYTQLEGIN